MRCSNVKNAFCNAELTCACEPGYSYYDGICQSGKYYLKCHDKNVHIQLTVVVSSTDNPNVIYPLHYLKLLLILTKRSSFFKFEMKSGDCRL